MLSYLMTYSPSLTAYYGTGSQRQKEAASLVDEEAEGSGAVFPLCRVVAPAEGVCTVTL